MPLQDYVWFLHITIIQFTKRHQTGVNRLFGTGAENLAVVGDLLSRGIDTKPETNHTFPDLYLPSSGGDAILVADISQEGAFYICYEKWHSVLRRLSIALVYSET